MKDVPKTERNVLQFKGLPVQSLIFELTVVLSSDYGLTYRRTDIVDIDRHRATGL